MLVCSFSGLAFAQVTLLWGDAQNQVPPEPSPTRTRRVGLGAWIRSVLAVHHPTEGLLNRTTSCAASSATDMPQTLWQEFSIRRQRSCVRPEIALIEATRTDHPVGCRGGSPLLAQSVLCSSLLLLLERYLAPPKGRSPAELDGKSPTWIRPSPRLMRLSANPSATLKHLHTCKSVEKGQKVRARCVSD